MKPPADAVLINANENPMGPCKQAQEAICAMAPLGGRYDLLDEGAKLSTTIAEKLNIPQDHIAVYAGSSEPLQYAVMAFTSPDRSLVTADPSYEAPMWAAASTGTQVRKVALAADYAHDVKAMVAADPNAGLIYICNPNNPTGTLTAKKDIAWALDNKPKGSVLLVDEAYIHLSDAPDVLDMVRAGKDVIVLRTFSKVYGMAGIRCGMALARPDLLAKLYAYGQNPLPVTAVAAANASLMQADPRAAAQENHRRHSHRNACMAQRQRLQGHRRSRVQLLHDRYRQARSGRDPRDDGEERLHRPRLAGVAQRRPRDGRFCRRHEGVPRGL